MIKCLCKINISSFYQEKDEEGNVLLFSSSKNQKGESLGDDGKEMKASRQRKNTGKLWGEEEKVHEIKKLELSKIISYYS